MKSDGFVAKDVVAGLDVGRDLHHPCEAVRDQDIRTPVSGRGAIVEETDFIDLEELKRFFVDSLAGVAARSEIVDHGPFVRIGPSVPGYGDAVASLDLGVTSSVCGILVADDIGASEAVRLDEAVVSLGSSPPNNGGRVLLVGEGGWVVTLIEDTIDHDVINVSVSDDGRNRRKSCEERGSFRGCHFYGFR